MNLERTSRGSVSWPQRDGNGVSQQQSDSAGEHLYRFGRRESQQVGRGAVGCLIPLYRRQERALGYSDTLLEGWPETPLTDREGHFGPPELDIFE